MPAKSKAPQVEVGDLFVTATALTVKLLPSKKTGSRPIKWFSGGSVTNAKSAARDIAYLVGKVGGGRRVVRALTVMTDRGAQGDPERAGLTDAIEKAGFAVLR